MANRTNLKPRDKNSRTRCNTYQGTSEKIKEFLGYGTKESTTEAYMRSLTILENYIKSDYNLEVDDLITKLETNQLAVRLNNKKTNIDVYQFLASCLKYLIKLGNEPQTIKNRMSVARAFIISVTRHKVVIDNRMFKFYVKLPKIIKKSKKGISKEIIIKLINGSSSVPRLRLILWFLAATSCRIGETLLLRISDLHLDGKPEFGLREPFLPYISIRGETTKTGQDRIVLLTEEITEQLRLWINNKYKPRSHTTQINGKWQTDKHYRPEQHPDDYLFMSIDRNYNESDAARFVYRNLVNQLHDVIESLKLKERAKNGQFTITFHKLRMGVRTRISDLGFQQSKEFADFYMGHDTSTYYQPTDDGYKEKFLLCKNELTYLDPALIEQTYGEVSSRIDKLEESAIAGLNKRILELEHREKQLLVSNKKMSEAIDRAVDWIKKDRDKKKAFKLEMNVNKLFNEGKEAEAKELIKNNKDLYDIIIAELKERMLKQGELIKSAST